MLDSIESYRGVKFVLRYLREVPLAWFIVGVGIARAGVFLSEGWLGNAVLCGCGVARLRPDRRCFARIWP